MSAEIEDMIKRLLSYPNVLGIIIIDTDGIPIKTTLDYTLTVHYAAVMGKLVEKAYRLVQDLDASNEFTFLRMRTLKHEVMIVPSELYCLITVQNPSS